MRRAGQSVRVAWAALALMNLIDGWLPDRFPLTAGDILIEHFVCTYGHFIAQVAGFAHWAGAGYNTSKDFRRDLKIVVVLSEK